MDISNPVVEFFISNAISILFGIVSVAAFIFSIVVYFKQKSRKEITWERISLVPVKGMKEAREVTLTLWNSGNVDILENDYLDPIKFNFGKGAKVTSVVVISTKPDGLKTIAEKSFHRDLQHPNKIIMAPLLLNKKYTIALNVRVVRFGKDIDIIVENSTRIIGIYDFFERRPLAEAAKGKLLFSSIVFILTGQVLGIGLQLILEPFYRFGLILGTFIACVTLFFRSYSPAIFWGYTIGWHKKVKTFKSLFWLWTKASIVFTIVTGIIVLPVIILFLLFGLPV